MKTIKMITFFSLLVLMISAQQGFLLRRILTRPPQSFDLGKNYYNLYGSPNITRHHYR